MTKKVKDGLAVIGSRSCSQLSALILTPIAARVMSAEEFGAWALVLVVVGFATIFADAGLGVYVIREKEFDSVKRSTVFWMAIGFGMLVAAVVAVAAYPASLALRIEQWMPAFWILAVSFVPHSVAGVLTSELRKKLRFGTILMIDATSAVLSICVAGYFLLQGFGLYSYAISVAILPMARVIWGLALTGFPSFQFDHVAARQALRFTSGLFGFSAINYWARKLDDLLIGRFLGTAALGPYAIAYRLMLLPISEVNRSVVNLVLPYLTLYQDRPEFVRKYLILTIQGIGAIVTPLMTILWLGRNEIVRLYLGPGWEMVAEILGVFAMVGLLQALVNPLGVAYQVSGKTGIFFRMGIWNTVVTAIGTVVGVAFGVYWVAVAYAVTNLLMLFPNIHVAFRSVEGNFGEWFRATWAWWMVPVLSWGVCNLALRREMSDVALIGLVSAIVLPVSGLVAWFCYRDLIENVLREMKRAG